jgi:hypothetical protein
MSALVNPVIEPFGRVVVNRDHVPAGAGVALAPGELMAAPRRLTARLPRLPDPAPQQGGAAIAVVRAGIGQLWPQVPPEAVCSVLAAAAEPAVAAEISGAPQAAAPGFAFAIKAASGRAADSQALTSVAVLPTLAHLGLPASQEQIMTAAGWHAAGLVPTGRGAR